MEEDRKLSPREKEILNRNNKTAKNNEAVADSQKKDRLRKETGKAENSADRQRADKD